MTPAPAAEEFRFSRYHCAPALVLLEPMTIKTFRRVPRKDADEVRKNYNRGNEADPPVDGAQCLQLYWRQVGGGIRRPGKSLHEGVRGFGR